MKALRRAVCCVVLLLVIVSVVHTGIVWIASYSLFRKAAAGSLLTRGGLVVGSRLIGQSFTGEAYFHPRPSVAGNGYDALRSGATNLGPTNPRLLYTVSDLARAYRQTNLLSEDTPLPVDAVTHSGSGLDPHISVDNARLQARRVARARALETHVVRSLIESLIEPADLGLFGEPRVNVLVLNLALDELAPQRQARRAGAALP